MMGWRWLKLSGKLANDTNKDVTTVSTGVSASEAAAKPNQNATNSTNVHAWTPGPSTGCGRACV